MYIFEIIQWSDKKVTGKKAVLEMKLFDDLSNNFSSTGNIEIVRMLYFFNKYNVNKTIDKAGVD